MLESRAEVQTINPLVGKTTTDTLDNLCQCLDKLGVSMAAQNDDNSIFFFCSSVSAALKYEAQQLRNQGKAASLKTAIRKIM